MPVNKHSPSAVQSSDAPYLNRWGKPSWSRPRVPSSAVEGPVRQKLPTTPARASSDISGFSGAVSLHPHNQPSQVEVNDAAPKKKRASRQDSEKINKLWNPRQPTLIQVQREVPRATSNTTAESSEANGAKVLDTLTAFFNQPQQETIVNPIANRRSRNMISKAPGATEYVPPHLRRSKRTPGGVSLDASPSAKDPQPEVIAKPSEESPPAASRRAPPHAPINDLPHDPAIVQASGPILTRAQSSSQEAMQANPKDPNGVETGLATPAPSSPEIPKRDHSKHASPKHGQTSGRRLPTTDQSLGTNERAAPQQQRKASRPPRETRNPRWPSNKETRAPKDGPKQWLSTSDNGGWSVHEDPGNDPDYDVKQLMDWTGQWMNAPGDWEGRGKYDDPNFKTRLVGWIEKHADIPQHPIDICDDHHKDFTAIQNGEMVNRDWVPITIGDDVANVWWSKHLRTGAEWLEDLHDKPFWEKYISSTSCLLAPLAVPDAELDPSDAEYARALQDAGSDAKTMDAIKKAASQEKRRKLTEKQERQAKLESKKAAAAATVFEPSQRPKVNIFLRLALPADGGQIAEIYNWHAENTINVPERTPRTRSMILDRIASSVEFKLPVLVAVEKAQRTKANRGLPYVQEKIVGYAIADDYHDIDEMMRYTATAEVYVHHDYFQKGVGRCLLDRLMHLLDPVYHSRGGYEFLGDGGPETLAGGRRVIENVIAYVNHETANPERIKWIERWLKQWDFAKVGDLPGIGIKQGKRVSQAIFHVKTGSILNPANAL